MALEVLVVDDEADIRDLVSGVLEDEGYAVRTAADSNQKLDAIEDRRPSMVLLDVWLQGSKLDGLQLLQEIKQRDSTIPVLMISGHGNLDTAVAREAMLPAITPAFNSFYAVLDDIGERLRKLPAIADHRKIARRRFENELDPRMGDLVQEQ